MNTGEILAIIGGWSVVVSGIFAWLSHLLTQRIMSQWRRDEQRTLETLRSESASDRMLLQAAITTHGSGQNPFQQHRLAAVERLWNSVLELREHFSRPVFFYSILLPSEYDSVLEKGGPLAALISELSEHTFTLPIEYTSEVEKDRPHLGETLWFLFFIYRAFWGRLTYLLVEGRRQGHIPDWRDEPGVRNLLSYILSEQQFMPYLNAKRDPSALNKVINLLEGLILEEISLITSGRRSSIESFENAETLRGVLSEWRTTQS